MIVEIKKLYMEDWSYGEQVEDYIGQTIADEFGYTFHDRTTGYRPEYDWKWNDTKIELKLTSCAWPAIEFARADGAPSGLNLSEAKYYLVLSPGGSKGQHVGKLRLFETKDLKEAMLDKLAHNDYRTYAPSDNSPGSKCFTINPQLIKDYWIGDCPLTYNKYGKVSGFHLGNITFKSPWGLTI